MIVYVCERVQVTHVLCQVLVSSFYPYSTFPLMLYSAHRASSMSKLLLLKTNREYQYLNQSHFQCDWDGPIISQGG